MPYEITGRRRPTKVKKQANAQKRKREDVDVDKLEQAVTELDTTSKYEKFADLPLSEPTKAGLKACHFTNLTDIQSRAIPLSLKGSDILGAAKTGSGKTLAFIIPVLENLYRAQCIGTDAGLGAMIISPTRELAIQIFDVLYKIGKHGHLFAAGLVIGGKSLQEEQNALARMNIVVCTPGRMLQHLSQTATFSTDNLRMLVLDEADRILDLGFSHEVDAIIEYLPRTRQTLLFSATQTKKISDLARLSLQNPEYISVHESAASATPQSLQQNYIITPLPEKLDTLWSFIQASKKSKIVVFLSSGKQVRFVYEAFRRLQPGIPLLHLHGRQKQGARLEITSSFAAARHSCLFATDVAARGLDFPAVDWVVQVDCPEDADTYIHRVGRTARYERAGRAVLFLDPSEEEGMLTRLAGKKVPIERINVRAKKQSSIRNQLQGFCFKDPELKYLGQKAFASYVRSLHVQKDKEVFKLDEYKLEEFASSLGLPGAPRIRFMKGDLERAKARKNADRYYAAPSDSEDEGDEAADGADGDAVTGAAKKKEKVAPVVRTRLDRMFDRRNQDVMSAKYTSMIENGDADTGDALTSRAGEAADDDLFTVKRHIPALSPSPSRSASPDPNVTTTSALYAAEKEQSLKDQTQPIDSNRRKQAALSRAKTAKKLIQTRAQHMVFDEATGEAREAKPLFDDETAVGRDEREREEARRRFVEEEAARMKELDVGDREVVREKRREKKMKLRAREREERLTGGEAEDVSDGDEDVGGVNGNGASLDLLEELYPAIEDDEKVEKKKQPKKWFQDPSDGEEELDAGRARKKAKRKQAAQQPPETLEDMEALAMGLLDG